MLNFVKIIKILLEYYKLSCYSWIRGAFMLDERNYLQFDIKRAKRPTAINMPYPHYHNYYEIYYLVKGKVIYFINNMSFNLKEGDMVLIPPGVIHRTAKTDENSTERILLTFSPSFLGKEKNNEMLDCFKHCHIRDARRFEKYLNSIENETIQKEILSEDMIKYLLGTMLIKLSRTLQNNIIETETDNDIRQIADYITDNYSTEITLDMLSEKFSISRGHLSRKFKTLTGFGINEYVNLVRIKNAEVLMNNPKLSITEIATICGFNDSSYFASVFRKQKGVSPRELRKTLL